MTLELKDMLMVRAVDVQEQAARSELLTKDEATRITTRFGELAHLIEATEERVILWDPAWDEILRELGYEQLELQRGAV